MHCLQENGVKTAEGGRSSIHRKFVGPLATLISRRGISMDREHGHRFCMKLHAFCNNLNNKSCYLFTELVVHVTDTLARQTSQSYQVITHTNNHHHKIILNLVDLQPYVGKILQLSKCDAMYHDSDDNFTGICRKRKTNLLTLCSATCSLLGLPLQ